MLELYNQLNNSNTVKKGQNKMLKQENSTRLDGQKAKEVEKLIKEYQDIKIQLQDLEALKKEVTARIFEIANIGINETNNLVFKVNENEGRETIPCSKVKENEPSIYNMLKEKNLVNKGESYKTITGIKVKK